MTIHRPRTGQMRAIIVPVTATIDRSEDFGLFVDGSERKCYLDVVSRMVVAMALSIKTDEADRLARELSRLTGETMTDAITQAMRERLERLRAEREAQGDYVARMKAFVRERAGRYDRRPVTQQEWDEAVGDTPEELDVSR